MLTVDPDCLPPDAPTADFRCLKCNSTDPAECLKLCEGASATVTPAPPEMEDVDDLLTDLPVERRDGFHVKDEDTASWVVDKLFTMDERIARYAEQMTRKLEALQKDRERFANRFLPELEIWAQANRPDAHKPKGSKYLDLDAGRIGFRKQAQRAKVVNETMTIAYLRGLAYLADLLAQEEPDVLDQALDFLEGRPDMDTLKAQAGEVLAADGESAGLAFLRETVKGDLAVHIREETVLKLDGKAIRDHVLENGEALPGVEIVPERETFYLEAPKT